MSDAAAARDGGGFVRRARPLLGTLVEIGVRDRDADHGDALSREAGSAAAVTSTSRERVAHTAPFEHTAESADTEVAIADAFAEIAALQSHLSRFEPASDIARFNALPAGEALLPCAATLAVLAAARALREHSAGLFDPSVGSAPDGWRCEDGLLRKLDARARLDLGGIAKGYAVDRAVQCLMRRGMRAGWVNAGGDLRAFGGIDMPVALRDERGGGVRPFARIADGAFATSRFGAGARSPLAGAAAQRAAHVSVAAPECLWADALTKVVALSGDTSHPLLARHGAQAWLH